MKRGRPFEKAGQQTAQRQPRERKLWVNRAASTQVLLVCSVGQVRSLRVRYAGGEIEHVPNLEDLRGQAGVRARLAWDAHVQAPEFVVDTHGDAAPWKAVRISAVCVSV